MTLPSIMIREALSKAFLVPQATGGLSSGASLPQPKPV